jgi:hypothetical protein
MRNPSMRAIAWSVPLSLAFGLVSAVSSLPIRAAEPEAPPKVPQVEDVLHSMSQYLAKAKAFSYHAEIVFDQVLPGGPKIQLSGAVDVAVQRPGKLFVDYRDDVSDRIVWFTDGRVTILDPVASTYAEVSGPRDIDGMVAKLEADYGFSLPLGELAENNAEQVLTRGVEVAHYVGIHDVEGIYCHHVVLQRKDIDIQVFVEVGDKPVPRKVVFDYPNRPGWPEYTASITEWSFEPPAKDLFEPKVPKDFAKVEFLPIQEGR